MRYRRIIVKHKRRNGKVKMKMHCMRKDDNQKEKATEDGDRIREKRNANDIDNGTTHLR